MTAECLFRTEKAHKFARKAMDAALRAQHVSEMFSKRRTLTSPREFKCLSDFFAATERWDRAANRRAVTARNLLRQAEYALLFGVTR